MTEHTIPAADRLRELAIDQSAEIERLEAASQSSKEQILVALGNAADTNRC